MRETAKPPFRIAGPDRGLNPVPRDLAFVGTKQSRAVIFTLRLVYAGETALYAHWIQSLLDAVKRIVVLSWLLNEAVCRLDYVASVVNG